MANTQTSQTFKGVVKQVLSGDAVIIRGQPKGGPPPEKQIIFSNTLAPKLGRRATATQPETEDEPYAWESREFLRKKIIGKEVTFTCETKTAIGREYGTVFLGKDVNTGENLTELMLSEGLLKVRRETRGDSRLIELEDQAKAAQKGMWGGNDNDHKRNLIFTVENPKLFVDKCGGKPIKAVVEHVRDGSTVRVCLVPEFQHITLMISGIRCPMFKLDSEGKPDKNNIEPFAEEARYFVESRLLHRDIEVILETASNNNFVGSVVHPNGNIAEALLKEGFAKCVDWTIATVTGGPEKLRAAEKVAKEKKLKLWKDYKPSASMISDKDKEFTGKVVEIINGDCLNVKTDEGIVKKIFLASIRPPRLQDESQKASGRTFRPLYDIPGLFNAREFLRKKLIGQRVQVTVDYVQPPQNNFPERTCCTVKIGDINVAEALVSKGLATVVRYRQDDDQRANCYDNLLSAEAKAIKSQKGIHSKKENIPVKVSDLSTDAGRAKGFFPSLQRAGTVDALVEFVAAGSRMRIYIEKEYCLITFLLAGISCPRPTRPAPGGVGAFLPEEPYGAEAQLFTKSLVLQRNVQIEVDTMDKGGNFIGWMHVDGKNLSVMLVEEGLSTVHVTAENSKYYSQISAAERHAKSKKLNMYSNYVEKEEKKVEEVISERRMDLKPVIVSEVTDDGRVYVQYCSDGPAVEKMMENIVQEFTRSPPLGGAYTPKRGDICACKFSADGQWYRAKVERLSGKKISVLYIDFGNREETTAVNLASLPSNFSFIGGYAHEIQLAFFKFHKDEDNLRDAIDLLKAEVSDREMLINKEYTVSGIPQVTMQHADTNTDVAKILISQGLALVEPRREKIFQPMVMEYRKAQEEAKKQHLNIWQYGDITDDDAHEFGMER